MALRLRPSVLALAFGVLFAVIANLAWATAVTTTGPWYGSAVSLQVYSTAIVVAGLLASVLALFAALRVSAAESTLRDLDRQIAVVRAQPAVVRGPVRWPSGLTSTGDRTGGGNAEADVSSDPASRTATVLEKQGHDTLVDLTDLVQSASSRPRTGILQALVRERIATREARAQLWWTAFGPVLMSVIFLAIAAPMLPGSDGFAAAHYQLNTALILFLAYGLAPLLAWTLISLGLLTEIGRPPIIPAE
jgi:hypothetical protein